VIERVAGAAIPLPAAARKMRLNARGMRKALALGLFPGVRRDARSIPASLVEDFAHRFMMLGEIREHLPGSFPTLKDTLERMGSGRTRTWKSACMSLIRARK